MNGNNGKGSWMGASRFAGSDRLTDTPEIPTEQLVDELADRLSQRLEGSLREHLGGEVLPRLEELEGKIEHLTSRPDPGVSEAGESLFAQQDLQRQARSRVD